jgi:hypothetical protein
MSKSQQRKKILISDSIFRRFPESAAQIRLKTEQKINWIRRTPTQHTNTLYLFFLFKYRSRSARFVPFIYLNNNHNKNSIKKNL